MKVRFAVAPDGASLPYADVAGFADVLEAGGFDGVVLSDIPLGPELDPPIGLALIAGRTSRLKLDANVMGERGQHNRGIGHVTSACPAAPFAAGLVCLSCGGAATSWPSRLEPAGAAGRPSAYGSDARQRRPGEWAWCVTTSTSCGPGPRPACRA